MWIYDHNAKRDRFVKKSLVSKDLQWQRYVRATWTTAFEFFVGIIPLSISFTEAFSRLDSSWSLYYESQ